MAYNILEGDPILDALARRRREAVARPAAMPSPPPIREHPVDTSPFRPPVQTQPARPPGTPFGPPAAAELPPEEPVEEEEPFEEEPPPEQTPPLWPVAPTIPEPPADVPQGDIGGPGEQAGIIPIGNLPGGPGQSFGAIEQALANAGASPIRLPRLGMGSGGRRRSSRYPRQRTFRF